MDAVVLVCANVCFELTAVNNTLTAEILMTRFQPLLYCRQTTDLVGIVEKPDYISHCSREPMNSSNVWNLLFSWTSLIWFATAIS